MGNILREDNLVNTAFISPELLTESRGIAHFRDEHNFSLKIYKKETGLSKQGHDLLSKPQRWVGFDFTQPPTHQELYFYQKEWS